MIQRMQCWDLQHSCRFHLQFLNIQWRLEEVPRLRYRGARRGADQALLFDFEQTDFQAIGLELAFQADTRWVRT